MIKLSDIFTAIQTLLGLPTQLAALSAKVDALQTSVSVLATDSNTVQLTEIQHTLNETQAAILQMQLILD